MIEKIINYKQYSNIQDQLVKPHLIHEIKEILLYIKLYSTEDIFNDFILIIDNRILNFFDCSKGILYDSIKKISFESSFFDWYEYLSCSTYFRDKKENYFLNLEDLNETEKMMKIIKMIRNNDFTAYYLNEIFLINSFVFNESQKKFKNENIIPNEIKNNSINERYLSNEFYNNDYKNIIVKSCTGSGKTTSVLNYIKKSGMKIIFISSRVSLAQDVSKKMNEMTIHHKIYNNLDGHPIFCGENFIIQYDSLKTVDDVIDQIYDEYQETKKCKYVLFLDEINNLLNYLCSSTTLRNKRCKTYNLFLKLVESCKVIASDNSITNLTYSFFNTLSTEKKYIYNTHQSWKGTKVEVFQDEEAFKLLILKKIKEGVKMNIISDSKSVCEIYKKELDIANNWTVQTSDTKYMDVSDWADVCVYSPKITVGVDDSKHEKELFLIVCSQSVDSMDLFQMITRCRKIIKLNIIFLKKEHLFIDSKYKTLEDVDIDLKNKKSAYNSLLLEYNIDLWNDGKINFKKSFYRIFRQHLYIKDMYFTSISKHLLIILENEGFNIHQQEVLSSDKSLADNLLTLCDIKKFKIDNFNITNEQYSKIQKILNIPEDLVKDYIELFIKKDKLNEHFSICDLFFDNITLDKKFKKNIEESEYNKMKQSTTKTKIINSIGELLNIKSVLDIEKYSYSKNKKIVISDELKTIYKGTFQRFKKFENCKTSNELMNIYGQLIYDHCGNIISKKQIMKNNKRFYTFSLKKDILNDHRTILNFRNKNNMNFKDVFQDKNNDIELDPFVDITYNEINNKNIIQKPLIKYIEVKKDIIQNKQMEKVKAKYNELTKNKTEKTILTKNKIFKTC